MLHLKSWRPARFWVLLKTAWSVATMERGPPTSAPLSFAAVPAPRMGGDMTKRAALSKSGSHLPTYH